MTVLTFEEVAQAKCPRLDKMIGAKNGEIKIFVSVNGRDAKLFVGQFVFAAKSFRIFGYPFRTPYANNDIYSVPLKTEGEISVIS